MIQKATQFWHNSINHLVKADGIAALALRLYLAPIFWMAGTQKLSSFNSTVEWFGNSDWGLGLPFPWALALLATAAELAGAVLLTLGLFTRAICIPLIVTMIIAITSVHGENGWQAIADPSALFANERVAASAEKIAYAREVLREHTNYDWITASGNVVILNNGIEFAVTYIVMLLALLFWGAGRYVSLDYWFGRKFLNFKTDTQQ